MKSENIGEEYDEEYYERGLSMGKSGYNNYRWLSKMTIEFASNIIKELGLKKGDVVLDYGCAKGFLVKALRRLKIEAYGCDISSYAIENADSEIREYCKLIKNNIPFDKKFCWVISKDVFEHLEEYELEGILREIKKISNNLFVIVPLGENNKFIIPSYDVDITHKLAKSEHWWYKKFIDSGWKVDRFSYLVKGMKENWRGYKKGNGFFHLSQML
jgi:SAM-dependent methyltransferase